MKISNIIRFLTVDIWRFSSYTSKRWTVWLKPIVLSVKLCFQRRLNVQASALTYYTFFATIPILAFIFAIGRGFGMDEYIENFFVQLFSTNAESSAVKLLFTLIENYLKHARGGVFIGIGIIFLLWSIFNVFTQIEKSLNDIWGIRKARPFVRRFTDYFSLTLLIPFLIIISSGLNIYVKWYLIQAPESYILHPVLRFILWIKPWLLCCLICTLVYLVIPNTKVKFLNALIAGILAGSAVLAFKILYLWLMKWATAYNAVYGSLAAIPILMLFIRIVWIILLCGAEISFAGQHFQMYDHAKEIDNISHRYARCVQLFLVGIIAKRYEENVGQYTIDEISKAYHLPPKLVVTMLERLCQCGILIEAHTADEEKEERAYLPALPVDRLSVEYVMSELDKFGKEDFVFTDEQKNEDPMAAMWAFVKQRSEEMAMGEKDKILVKDLV